MTDALLQKLEPAFRPDLFVNHYVSTEIYTFTVDQNAAKKPGSSGRAVLIRWCAWCASTLPTQTRSRRAGEEGEIAALLAGDLSFEGYWWRPEANAAAIHDGWYFTGDTDEWTPTATYSSPAGWMI